ncbi:MAG: hypothetical protein CO103_08375, partial [Chloroflexi bacterium CG_4_9_14_3_um_filter_45_9]
ATTTYWSSNFNTAYLEVELADTTTIGGAGLYRPLKGSGNETFLIQFWAEGDTWDTACIVENYFDTNVWTETFPACVSKYWRLQFTVNADGVGTDTPIYIREFYLLPQG